MHAIIKTGGKQYRVSVGDIVDVELLNNTDQGAKVEFGEILFVSDGSETHLDKKSLSNYLVSAEVLGVVQGEKVTSLKYKRSHNQCRKWGHRQKYTRLKITSIGKQRKS